MERAFLHGGESTHMDTRSLHNGGSTGFGWEHPASAGCQVQSESGFSLGFGGIGHSLRRHQ